MHKNALRIVRDEFLKLSTGKKAQKPKTQVTEEEIKLFLILTIFGALNRAIVQLDRKIDMGITYDMKKFIEAESQMEMMQSLNESFALRFDFKAVEKLNLKPEEITLLPKVVEYLRDEMKRPLKELVNF